MQDAITVIFGNIIKFDFEVGFLLLCEKEENACKRYNRYFKSKRLI